MTTKDELISAETRVLTDMRREQFDQTLDALIEGYAETRQRIGGTDDSVMLLLFTADHRLADQSSEVLADLLVTALARIDRARTDVAEAMALVSSNDDEYDTAWAANVCYGALESARDALGGGE